MIQQLMPQVVVFDFDGTLTRHDSFLEFVRFVHGRKALWFGLLRHAGALLLMMLHLVDHSRVKERVFSTFFRGMPYTTFCELGRSFAEQVDRWNKDEMLSQLKHHVEKGDRVYVVTASVEEWVCPWCERQGVLHVIGTQVETDKEGRLTGRFKTKNCYGAEKVMRLLAWEPNRKEYRLKAYGDSRGDREMLQFADEAKRVR